MYKKNHSPRKAAENKMRDRSLSKGITGNANYSQIIPVPSRDQVQIKESFLQSKLYADLQFSLPESCFQVFLYELKLCTSGN